MYEWETDTDKSQIEKNISYLREEIKIINNTTLRGNFAKEEDRIFWQNRVKQLNSKLNAFENMK